jgi:methylmalonyl-CoA mutase
MSLEYNEFEIGSADRWEELVVKELKGRSVEDISWEVERGVSCVPFKSEVDVHDRGLFRVKVEGSYQWRIQRDFERNSWSENSKEITDSLNLGTNSIRLKGAQTWDEVQKALSDVHTEAIQVQIPVNDAQNLSSFLSAALEDRASIPHLAFELDSSSIETGNAESDTCFRQAIEAGMPVLLVDTGLSEQGAPVSLELGITLAKAHDALVELLKHRGIDEVTPLMRFRLGIGSSYLTEISKFRAFRLLWNRVVAEYEPEHDCSGYAYIHGYSSAWNMTHADSHTNLLRLTTECASAAIGGADSIHLHPYDLVNQKGDQDANRISTNIHNVLLWEGRLGVTRDPAEGAYFIEDLTSKLGDVAWEIFKQIEGLGGYGKAQLSGELDKLIDDHVAENVGRQKENATLIGVNKFKNATESGPVNPEGHRLETILKD